MLPTCFIHSPEWILDFATSRGHARLITLAESSHLLLKEAMPADIALDIEYRKELGRRQSLPGIPAASPKTIEQENAEIIKEDSDPLFLSLVPSLRDFNHPDPALQRAVQECREASGRESHRPTN